MIGQLSFEDTHTRATDVITSRQAAAAAKPAVGGHKRIVLDAILRAGANGATCGELADLLPLTEQQINRRTADLHSDGLIFRTDDTRPTGSLMPNGNRCAQKVWYPEGTDAD